VQSCAPFGSQSAPSFAGLARIDESGAASDGTETGVSAP
jgi:hypothetical protein